MEQHLWQPLPLHHTTDPEPHLQSTSPTFRSTTTGSPNPSPTIWAQQMLKIMLPRELRTWKSNEWHRKRVKYVQDGTRIQYGLCLYMFMLWRGKTHHYPNISTALHSIMLSPNLLFNSAIWHSRKASQELAIAPRGTGDLDFPGTFCLEITGLSVCAWIKE